MAERPAEARELLDRVVREEYPRILTAVARSVGDLDLAEDALQDAIGAAIASWARSGPPEVPAAWLTTVARRRAIDVLRREGRRDELEARSAPPHDEPVEPHTGPLVDDQLRLMLVTCHPSLTPDTQVTLTLRYVCGLRTEEIARLLLVEPDTVTKRIRRARRKIRDARILLRVPPAHRLAERVRPVLDCLYLVFTEGYAATTGDAWVRVDLCAEASREPCWPSSCSSTAGPRRARTRTDERCCSPSRTDGVGIVTSSTRRCSCSRRSVRRSTCRDTRPSTRSRPGSPRPT
jgi:RNA polymerase sigma-70 factor (ECF subfamily)